MHSQLPARVSNVQQGKLVKFTICFGDSTVAVLTQHYFAAAALAGLVCMYGDSPPIEAA